MANTGRYKDKAKGYPQPIIFAPIPPLPYYPSLKPHFLYPTCVLLFTYFELECPPKIDPQDPNRVLSDLPFAITMRQLRARFNSAGRTMSKALESLCAVYGSKEKMFAAKRAGRQFYKANQPPDLQIKPYAIIGNPQTKQDNQLLLYRNHAKINDILSAARLTESAPLSLIPHLGNSFKGHSSVSTLRTKDLAAILARSDSQWLGEDRRKTRYDRQRAAIAAGIAPASIMRVRRSGHYARWTDEARAEQSVKIKAAWARRKESMDNPTHL